MTDFSKPLTKSAPRRRKKLPPLAGTEGRGGVTPLEQQREISKQAGFGAGPLSPTEQAYLERDRTMPDVQPPGFDPNALQHGVEDYVPMPGTEATLPPEVLAAFEAQTQGPLDRTLKNLALAHYQVFGEWPDFSLTADVLDSGEVEFATVEEAVTFFRNIKRSFAGTGNEWMLDSGSKAFGAQPLRNARKGWTGETDLLDPEMIASFRPKNVEDFLQGPYLKHTVEGQTKLFREGRMRLDELLIALPRQWAISQLSGHLDRRGNFLNPDQQEDERLMRQLNVWLAERVPEMDLKPAPTAAWQVKTEQALRYVAAMRAGALYFATAKDGEATDVDATAYLHDNGFGQLADLLDQQIRMPAGPTGLSVDDQRKWVQEKTAMVEQMWLASRMPGESERQSLHALSHVNENALTLESQKLVGGDHVQGWLGAVQGFFGSIPVINKADDLFRTDEFKAAARWAVPIAADIWDVVEPGVKPLLIAADKIGLYYKYAHEVTVALHQMETDAGLTIGGAPLSDKVSENRENLWTEHMTVWHEANPDHVPFVGDFIERFKYYLGNVKKDAEAGRDMRYMSELMRDMDISPEAHPDFAFLSNFAFETLMDVAVGKGAGMAASAIRATRTFKYSSRLAATKLNIRTEGRMIDDIYQRNLVGGDLDKDSFMAQLANVFNVHNEDAAELAMALTRKGTTESRYVIDQLVPQWAKTGRNQLDPDNWGIHYRLREKFYADPTSWIYRSKHHYTASVLEKLFKDPTISVREGNVYRSARHIGFQYRTAFRSTPVAFRRIIEEETASAHLAGNILREEALRRIADSGDMNRLADFMVGRYMNLGQDALEEARSNWEKWRTRLVETMEPGVERDGLLAETFDPAMHNVEQAAIGRRALFNSQIDDYVDFAVLSTPARKMFAKWYELRHPVEARLWRDRVRELSKGKNDFLPMAIERKRFQDPQITEELRPKEGVTDVELFDREQILGAEQVYIPRQGGTISQYGTVEKHHQETSKAMEFNALVEMLSSEADRLKKLEEALSEAGLPTRAEIKAALDETELDLTAMKLAERVSKATEAEKRSAGYLLKTARDIIRNREAQEAREAAVEQLRRKDFPTKTAWRKAKEEAEKAAEAMVRQRHSEDDLERNEVLTVMDEVAAETEVAEVSAETLKADILGTRLEILRTRTAMARPPMDRLITSRETIDRLASIVKGRIDAQHADVVAAVRAFHLIDQSSSSHFDAELDEGIQRALEFLTEAAPHAEVEMVADGATVLREAGFDPMKVVRWGLSKDPRGVIATANLLMPDKQLLLAPMVWLKQGQNARLLAEQIIEQRMVQMPFEVKVAGYAPAPRVPREPDTLSTFERFAETTTGSAHYWETGDGVEKMTEALLSPEGVMLFDAIPGVNVDELNKLRRVLLNRRTQLHRMQRAAERVKEWEQRELIHQYQTPGRRTGQPELRPRFARTAGRGVLADPRMAIPEDVAREILGRIERKDQKGALTLLTDWLEEKMIGSLHHGETLPETDPLSVIRTSDGRWIDANSPDIEYTPQELMHMQGLGLISVGHAALPGEFASLTDTEINLIAAGTNNYRSFVAGDELVHEAADLSWWEGMNGVMDRAWEHYAIGQDFTLAVPRITAEATPADVLEAMYHDILASFVEKNIGMRTPVELRRQDWRPSTTVTGINPDRVAESVLAAQELLRSAEHEVAVLTKSIAEGKARFGEVVRPKNIGEEADIPIRGLTDEENLSRFFYQMNLARLPHIKAEVERLRVQYDTLIKPLIRIGESDIGKADAIAEANAIIEDMNRIHALARGTTRAEEDVLEASAELFEQGHELVLELEAYGLHYKRGVYPKIKNAEMREEVHGIIQQLDALGDLRKAIQVAEDRVLAALRSRKDVADFKELERCRDELSKLRPGSVAYRRLTQHRVTLEDRLFVRPYQDLEAVLPTGPKPSPVVAQPDVTPAGLPATVPATPSAAFPQTPLLDLVHESRSLLGRAVIPEDPELIALSKEATRLEARLATQLLHQTQRRNELGELQIEMWRLQQALDARDALRGGGVVRTPLTDEQVQTLRSVVRIIDPNASLDQLADGIRDQIDLATTAMQLIETNPGAAARFIATLSNQPGMEWQLHEWSTSRYNYSKLAKFQAGFLSRGLERAYSSKFFFGAWSVDDLTTLYKTYVMAKISTMLRIPLADEFVRFIALGINPMEAWKDAHQLRRFDKLPDDLKFKVSKMIRDASENSAMTFIDYSAKEAWVAYQHIAGLSRRDSTYARFLHGKLMLEAGRRGELDGELQSFMAEGGDDGLHRLVGNYLEQARDATDEATREQLWFKAWYSLGYAKGGALRTTGLETHRFVKFSEFEAEPAVMPAPHEQSLWGRNRKTLEVEQQSVEQGGVKVDSSGLVDALYQQFDYFFTHDTLRSHWRPKSISEAQLQALKQSVPEDLEFGWLDKRHWTAIGRMMRKDPQRGSYLQPVVWGRKEVATTGGIPQLRKARDGFYSILDAMGSKQNEWVYAKAFRTQVDELKERFPMMSIEEVEKRASFTAREFVERVMFTNMTYMGEDMIRNLLMFFPAYRQFVEFWLPQMVKQPAWMLFAARANQQKEELANVQVGPLSLDVSRMNFLISQGDNTVTGFLPSGAPMITMPVSLMAHVERNNQSNIWGQLAGNWPFEFAGEYSALNSPFDKMVYGATGWTLPWPLGSDPTKNPWRALQLVREAELRGVRMEADDAKWQVRMQRLWEGGWNFLSPVGMRFNDQQVTEMIEARRSFNQAPDAKTAQEVLDDPVNKKFKTFIEWQNLPSFEQLAFLKKHPEIVPYMVSGFTSRKDGVSQMGFLWSEMRDYGVPDPENFLQNVDAKYRMINKVIAADKMRKEKTDEEKWWRKYRTAHKDDHDIYRLDNEFETSTGEFAPGGRFFLQGHPGVESYRRDLDIKFTGITDPFIGISNYTGDAFRYAEFMDTMGGHARALLQMSPNYEMYVMQKLRKQQDATREILKGYSERRMTTRLNPEQIRQAGFKEDQIGEIMSAVATVDRLWDGADKAVDAYGKYGYATKEGRAIRKAAIIQQNRLIHSSPTLEKFLGENIAFMYGSTYLTKPAWERDDLVRLDKMDPKEREMFYHLTTDQPTHKMRWDGLYIPEGEKKKLAGAEFLGYVPSKGGWMTKVRMGEVVGLVKGKVPKEKGLIELTWKQGEEIMVSLFDATPSTVKDMKEWRRKVETSGLPEWAVKLVEEHLRAEAWRYYLKWAKVGRKELRETINEYYSDAPGFSIGSKLGLSWKNSMNRYGTLLGRIAPAFGKEYRRLNDNNEMINSILGWYL